ncbi:hypothetical protein GCM10012284_33050 [Mangrovihabitans endophyticus]|uniref:ARB-07466-like C-terminal domain-containing protein n=2 Tax=Mangrovihabitans endophyticus TaxID=1751298 RepID=A0A8J3FPK8_9ACTN|nr:hypothetical protein GCM10012284_33050 [Mangrovihabitans endophyticus]
MAAALLRRTACVCASIVAFAMLAVAPGSPAWADPEGGSKTLREQLESAAKGHVEAKQKLDASKKRQKQLQTALIAAQVDAKSLEDQVKEVADRSYRLGRFNTMSMLLSSSSPNTFLQRVQGLDMMAQINGQALVRYQAAVTTAERAKKAIDLEVKEQSKQVTVMAKKKEQAEQALASVGGGGAAGGFAGGGSASAKAAPRNSDGSLPSEGCTVNDPTTSGCITPRLLNAYQQARAASFKRYTSCFSQRSSGEHPKGRACDFSAAAGGFENVAATGDDKSYGDSLAAYLVKNASRLGVMYVIWYRQIWMPSTGWRKYSATGDPAAVHTNHVHLSVL